MVQLGKQKDPFLACAVEEVWLHLSENHCSCSCSCSCSCPLCRAHCHYAPPRRLRHPKEEKKRKKKRVHEKVIHVYVRLIFNGRSKEQKQKLHLPIHHATYRAHFPSTRFDSPTLRLALRSDHAIFQ